MDRDDPRVPTRAELAQEEYEDWLVETYEERFSLFCVRWGYDPESTDAVLAYEEHWIHQREEEAYERYGSPQ